MLIDFTVSNFRSIKEPQTLSMLATNDKELLDNTFVADDIDKTRLLRTAVIYGANGSGKSNVILSFYAMTGMIYESANFKRGEDIRYYHPFKLEEKTVKEPVRFEIEFIASDKIRYRYGFSFNSIEIQEEFLYAYPKKQETRLFSRKRNKNIDFGSNLSGNKKSIESLLLPNQLFLSKAANNNHEQLGTIYDFFHKAIAIELNKDSFNNYKSEKHTESIVRNPVLLKKLTTLLAYADTGVKDINIHTYTDRHILDPFNPDSELVEITSYKIKTIRNFYDTNQSHKTIEFELFEESEGTQKLYYLGSEIVNAMQENSVIFIDELNNSFHPLLTEMLIKLFQNPETNPNNVQLIFTTHDTSILRSDLFRRDQIWFTEKDTYGATSLYSLAEFDKSKVRANIPYDKWYLSGRFGALPLIKDMDFLKDEPKPETNAKAKKRK